MHPLKRLGPLLVPMLLLPALLVLVPVLIGLGEAGCSPCSCPNSEIHLHFPAELGVQFAATGDACPTPPHCNEHGDGGGCTDYQLVLTSSGTCTLTATAADGRQVTTVATAKATYVNDCCGTLYDPESPVSLSFDQDASTGAGG